MKRRHKPFKMGFDEKPNSRERVFEPIHIPDAPATKSQTPRHGFLPVNGMPRLGQTHFHTAAKWVAQSQLPSTPN